jgi:macrolide transport system ATP-binding/permease protein
VLFLDEPTNYISLDVLEAFESALLEFPGPIIAISHDRWFIRRFGGVIWELENGNLLKHDQALSMIHLITGATTLDDEADLGTNR